MSNKNIEELENEREGLLQSEKEQQTSVANTVDEEPEEEEEDEDLEYHAETVITVLKPVALTMLFVVWAVRTINLSSQSQSGATSVAMIAYTESENDSGALRFGGAMLNALIFLVVILVTTLLFVILYKYRCLRIIYGWLITSSLMMLALFGGYFIYLLLDAYGLASDWISFTFFLWNFAVVGILAIFWHGPTKVNQGYLILISGLLAIFFTRVPEWTTFAILAVVAIYDLFAVLCPRGPLKVLVETAQQRQEPIPALLYNAAVFFFMADKESQTPAPQKRKGVKLGLGDFVFYSVLIGRASMFDMITVFSCFVAIITGLFLTLLLLAIFRKALPALPISIALGLQFYFITRIFLLPYIIEVGKNGVFV